jgi:hypothetical protein
MKGSGKLNGFKPVLLKETYGSKCQLVQLGFLSFKCKLKTLILTVSITAAYRLLYLVGFCILLLWSGRGKYLGINGSNRKQICPELSSSFFI